MTDQQQALLDLEIYWCQRMTHLVEQNKIGDVDALYSEFVIGDCEPFLNKKEENWIFV